MAFWNKKEETSTQFNNITQLIADSSKPSSQENSGVEERQANINPISVPPSVYTPIPVGVKFKGDVYYDMPVVIEGEFTGEIRSSSKILLKKTAKISGKIIADTLVVEGRIDSEEIRIFNKLRLESGSVVAGNINCKSVAISNGARIVGSLNINEKRIQEKLVRIDSDTSSVSLAA